MVKFLHQQNLKPLRVWNFFVSAMSCWICGVSRSKSFTFSSVQSAGKPIKEAVTLHAFFHTFMTFSSEILLVNLQMTNLDPGVTFLVGVRWAILIYWIKKFNSCGLKEAKTLYSCVGGWLTCLYFRETDDWRRAEAARCQSQCQSRCQSDTQSLPLA